MAKNGDQINTVLCKQNCGFFGNATYDGYCSKCYKDMTAGTGAQKPTSASSSSYQPQQTSIAQSAMSPPSLSSSSSSSSQLEIIQQQQQKDMDAILSASMDQVTSSTSTKTTSEPISIPSKPVTSNENNSKFDQSYSLPACQSSVDDMSTSIGSASKKSSRCAFDTCKRKVGITGFDCRCGGLFCWEHRYSDKHNCQFDYKEMGQSQIRKNNPSVIGEKIKKL